jgi:hypothetical protein
VLYINVIYLVVTAWVIGYIFGKGKIEIVKKVYQTKEQEEKMNKMIEEQRQAMERYNESIKAMTDYI